jgi:nucleolar GTP-binding protein
LQELTVPLGHWLKRFPDAAKLHPFERSLLVLTLGDGVYETALARVNALRKKILDVGKQHASSCAKATNVREADERRQEVGEPVISLFLKYIFFSVVRIVYEEK